MNLCSDNLFCSFFLYGCATSLYFPFYIPLIFVIFFFFLELFFILLFFYFLYLISLNWLFRQNSLCLPVLSKIQSLAAQIFLLPFSMSADCHFSFTFCISEYFLFASFLIMCQFSVQSSARHSVITILLKIFFTFVTCETLLSFYFGLFYLFSLV